MPAAKCSARNPLGPITKESTEESVIVSDDIQIYIESLVIDEDRKLALTNHVKNKRGSKKKESDHNVMVSNLNFQLSKRVKKYHRNVQSEESRMSA